MRKIAITGGLSCGKSTVCRIFESLGAYSVSADEIVHQLLSPTTSLGQQVVQLLGTEIVENQKINRKKIAEIVFSNPQKLQALENILHPTALYEIKQRFYEAGSKNYPLLVAEIPLLFETESQKFFDCVVVVVAKEEFSKKRFQENTTYDLLEYDKRVQRQWHPDKKAAHADYVIENNGSIDDLKVQVRSLFNILAN